MIEIMTFRLAVGADESMFRAVDERLQVGVAYHQAGLLRRTLGRRDDRWLVLQVWASAEAAAAGREALDESALGMEFMALLDRESIAVECFDGVD